LGLSAVRADWQSKARSAVRITRGFIIAFIRLN
jgi:hypothetical protein